MKKIAAMGFVFVMLMSLFVGCSNSKPSTTEPNSNTTSEEKKELIIGIDDKKRLGFVLGGTLTEDATD